MGYRSTIYIKLEHNLVPDLEQILKTHDLVSYFKVSETQSKHTVLEAENLKWYSGYTSIDAINTYIETYPNKAALLGIGEDMAESVSVNDPEEVDMHYSACVDY